MREEQVEKIRTFSSVKTQVETWGEWLVDEAKEMIRSTKLVRDRLNDLHSQKADLTKKQENLKNKVVKNACIPEDEQQLFSHIYVDNLSSYIKNRHDANKQYLQYINGIYYLQVGKTLYSCDQRLLAPLLIEEKNSIHSTQVSPVRGGEISNEDFKNTIPKITEVGKELFAQMDKVISEELLVIYSMEGKSRSAAFVALYLIHSLQNDHGRVASTADQVVDKIIAAIRSKEKNIWIGHDLRKQLIDYTQALYNHRDEALPTALFF